MKIGFFIFCVLLLFILFASISFFLAAINKYMLKSPHIVYLRNNEEQAEGLIRNALIKYPTSNIVVIDNGSTDNTVSIVKKLAEKHKRIILMSNNQQLTDKMSND